MTVDPINKINNLFPSYSGDNDNFINLVNKTSHIISKWFSDSEKLGPLPIDFNINYPMPEETGNPPDVLFEELESLIYNSFNPLHPGSLAHLDPPPLLVSIIGDLVAASLNNNLLAHELSPSISHLEDCICNWFTNKVGFSNNAGGITASGGTLSNLNALVAARFNSGLDTDPNAVFIISEDAHSSFKKCVRIMGLNENSLITVKTDEKGRMDINNLLDTIDMCKSKDQKIFSIVGTLGTTIRGAIDPIDDLSRICKVNNIWLHIDGSIGGIFAISNSPIKELNNIKKANSITINPQKILGITKTSSILLVSDFSVLKKTFNTGLPYVASNNNFVDRGEIGIQGSRPAEIIKLWLGLRYLGMKGLDNILSMAIYKRAFLENNLNKDKFLINSGPLHIISFVPKGLNNKDSDLWTLNKKRDLLEKNFMLSRPIFKNKYFLRAVLGNYNTDNSHILELSRILNN